MSDDLIARLRSPEEIVFPAGTKIISDNGKTMELLEPFSMWSSSSDKHDAAAEIVRLRARVEELWGKWSLVRREEARLLARVEVLERAMRGIAEYCEEGDRRPFIAIANTVRAALEVKP
jgi:hypothetical protein